MTMKTISKLLSLLCLGVTAYGQVNLKGKTVDANQGYTYQGTAPVGTVLCGNGSKMLPSGSCPIVVAMAAALAATPSQCSGSTPMSTGVTANGNANCAPVPVTSTVANSVLSNRVLGNTYQNSNAGKMGVFVSFSISGSYGQDASVSCKIGQTATAIAFFSNAGIHNAAGQATTVCVVPAGWYYQLYQDNTNLQNPQTPSLTAWWEVLN